MVYRIIVRLIFSVLVAFLPVATSAAAPEGKGLYISPIRQELTVASGKMTKSSITVADLTDAPMTVTLSVQQFSVDNYSYNYNFQASQNNWLKFEDTQTTILPHQTQKIPYDITIPAKTAPGGYYYALFANTQVAGNGLPTTIQATSLLYLTVSGTLIRTSVLQNNSLPFIVTGSDIPYKFDVKDTGNVHFSAYSYGQLQGLFFGNYPQTGTGHILMPGAPRTISGSIPTPIFPGVYKVTYGYKVDFADFTVTKSAYILFIPPWSVIAFILIILAGRQLWLRKHRSSKKSDA